MEDNRIGPFIAELRWEKGMTQRELAEIELSRTKDCIFLSTNSNVKIM